MLITAAWAIQHAIHMSEGGHVDISLRHQCSELGTKRASVMPPISEFYGFLARPTQSHTMINDACGMTNLMRPFKLWDGKGLFLAQVNMRYVLFSMKRRKFADDTKNTAI